ncbi:MAG TPA: TonB-dependent receptor [Rhizomicrobium sp.]|nr:TonB-dependent receptor [Rhizomicrobium sp.]
MSLNTALRSRNLRSSLMLGAASLAALWASTPAMAQDEAVETVVVTGSRIPQTGLYSTSPVTVVGSQDVQLQGAVNAESLLNQLPQNIGGVTSGFDISASGTASVNLRNLGSARTLVLVDGKRYVPATINGAGILGAGVDLDAIPTAMIDHVEVVTGGASAVYGSDAIAGVVNILLKKDFEGAEITGTYSAYPDYNMDGQTADVNGILGFSSGDGKGNVTMWGGYTHREAVSQATRKFGAQPFVSNGCTSGQARAGACTPGFNIVGSGSVPQGGFYIATGPNAAPFAGGTGGPCYHYTGTADPLTNFGKYEFNSSGTFSCSTGASSDPQPGSTFNFNPQQLNQTEQTRYNFGANGHYEINKGLDLYARMLYSNNRIGTAIASAPTSFFNFNVNADNPFLSPALKNLLFGTPTPAPGTPDAVILLAKRMLDFGPRKTEFTFDSFEMVVGAKGDLGDGWNYDISAQYGKSESQQWNTGFVSYSNLQDSIDVIADPSSPTGFSCRSGNAGCVPFNIYNLNPSAPGQFNAGVQGYDGVNFALLTQVVESVVTGSVAGDLGSIGGRSPWAKDPIAVAFGAEYRQEQGFVRPDATLASGNALGLSGAVRATSGAYSVTEGFGEVKIPLVEGMPFIEDLELEGGYRYSSYSNAGATTTYKYGGSWQPIDDIKFRALWQRAVRAPNIAELFTPPAIGLNSATDPCQSSQHPTGNLAALCIATGAHAAQPSTCNAGQCNVLVGGNANLRPETADTKTFGIVLTPTFIDGLTATIDYYDINVQDAVGTLQGSPQGVLNACYFPTGGITNVAAQAASLACQAVVRDITGGFINPAGYINQLDANTATLHPTGIDVGVNYQMDLSQVGWNDAGSLAFNLNGTYQDTNKLQGGVTQPLGDCAGYYGNFCGVPDPKYRFNLRVNWTDASGDVLISARWRYLGSVRLDTDHCIGAAAGTCVVNPANFDAIDEQIPSVSYFDLSGVWNVREGLSLTAGIQNLFNKKPPLVDSNIDANENNSNTFPGVYDIQGRQLFVSGTLKF